MELVPTSPPRRPRLSVVVPTYGRGDAILRLCDALADQSVPSDAFEVIVVDDGSCPAVPLDPSRYPYDCTVVWQPNRGPAAARNRAIALARAPQTLILNDDAVPARDLLEKHIAAHREVGPRSAILGTFHFTEAARQSPFVRVLDSSNLLFEFSGLEHGKHLPWQYFWTCNISLATDALRRVGGFDAVTFDRAICEDVELGYRLAQQGVDVVFREDCVAWHEHQLTPRDYVRRAFLLGRFQCRFGRLHDGLLHFFPAGAFEGGDPSNGPSAGLVEQLRELFPKTERLVAELEQLEADGSGRPLPATTAQEMVTAIRSAMFAPWLAGMVYEMTGKDVRTDGAAVPA